MITDTDYKTISALGNSINDSFTIGFQFQANSQLSVFLKDESTTPDTLTEIVFGVGPGKYTVSGGDPGTTVVVGTPPNSQQRIVIIRVTPLQQTVDYVETEAFPSEDHEETMDRAYQALQELSGELDVTISLSQASTFTDLTYPDPVANYFVVFNNAGDDFTYAPTVGTPSAGNALVFDGDSWELFDLSAALSGAGFITAVSDTATVNLTVLAGVLTADVIGGGVTDHGALTGLSDDDHPQYLLLAGRIGGQIAYGGTAASNNLVLRSTQNATKGQVYIDETTATTSASTGALRVGGGIGVGGAAWINGSLNAAVAAPATIGQTTNFNGWVSISNPDASNTYAALVVKHEDGLGNHQDIFKILDATGITEYIRVDYTGQSTFQNLTMANLFSETILYVQDISTGACVNFGTSFVDPGVPSDGFKFFANPFGGSPAWVTADPYYLTIEMIGAGTDAANTTIWSVSDQGNAAASRYYVVGQYNTQPVIAKRLGQSLTAVSTTATQNALGDGIAGGANITATVTTINGITSPESTYTTAGRSGSRYVVRNKSTNIITINHLSGSAAGTDQIRTPNGLPYYLMPEQACEFHYDTGTTDWRLIADVSDDGAWTPTLTNTANVSASTAYECTYIAHGKRLFGSGKVDIDPTTTATLTQLRMTLPFTVTNFAAVTDVSGGFITTGGVNECGDIIAVVGAQTIEFNWTCVDVTNKTRRFWFSMTRV